MTKQPNISLADLIHIREEAFSARRDLFDDHMFFKMTDAWEKLCDEGENWRIKRYRSRENEDYKRKAGVIALMDKVTLTADDRLWKVADEGREFANFLLAHELGHLICDHHSRAAVTLNFQLIEGPNGMSTIPPTAQEFEANLAAVFFQCGPEIEMARWSDRELARRAHSDQRTVSRVRKYIRLPEYQREILKPRRKNPRVIL